LPEKAAVFRSVFNQSTHNNLILHKNATREAISETDQLARRQRSNPSNRLHSLRRRQQRAESLAGELEQRIADAGRDQRQ
jgi:hypothetical protein